MTHIRMMLAALEDPFEIFPMQSVAGAIASLITIADERRFERNGWPGVSDRYRSVDQSKTITTYRLSDY
jgi:hypothetical protein